MSHPTFAVDVETYYDSECSIKTLGLDAYVAHPSFDCYLMTVVGTDGTRWAGRPEAFDWSRFRGAQLVSHKASFDEGVLTRLAKKGLFEIPKLSAWDCSADMTAYLGFPRSLANASKFLLGEEISKDVRDKMKGKRWEDMPADFRDEVVGYAMKDSELCLRLWVEHGARWPDHERRVSRLTRESAERGMHVDVEGLKEDAAHLGALLVDIETRIPWADTCPLLSYPAFANAVREAGYVPPASLAKDDPETDAWMAAHPQIPWVQDLRDYRSANAILKKVQTLRGRVREDGRVSTPLLYYGAHTGRDSGSAGINFQNLSRGEIHGVSLRKRLVAGPGKVLLASDLSAIEPRVLSFLAKDAKMLSALKTTSDLYEAQARAWNMFSDPRPLKEADPDLRHTIKMLALGLGYGMSARTFSIKTGYSEAEADRLVRLYRSKNKPITDLWAALKKGLEQSVGSDFRVRMPSGRDMLYRSVQKNGDGISAIYPKNGGLVRLRTWHGTITENITQAVARDIMMSMALKVSDAGIPIVLRVHDELVCEVDEADAEDAKAEIVRIMSLAPEFVAGIPLSCEAFTGKTYADL